MTLGYSRTTRVVMKLTPLGKSPVRSLSVTFGQAPPNASDPDHDKLRTRFWQKFLECPKPVVGATNPPSPTVSDLNKNLIVEAPPAKERQMAARKKSRSSGLTTRMKRSAPARGPSNSETTKTPLIPTLRWRLFSMCGPNEKSGAPQMEIQAFIVTTDDRTWTDRERGKFIETSLHSNPLSKRSSIVGLKYTHAH